MGIRARLTASDAGRPGPVALRLALAVSLLAAAASLPAAADWLVTRDGQQIQTQGSWEVKGKLVVFILPNGTLSSLRLSEVDLEASEELTGRQKTSVATQGQAARKTERRKPVLVLTDADVGHVLPGASQEPNGESDEEAEGGDSAGELGVASWKQRFDNVTNGVELTGTVQNGSGQTNTDVKMTVLLYNANGSLAGRAQAELQAGVLRPGQRTEFRASFPGILGFDRPEFRLEGTPLQTKPPRSAQQEEPDLGEEEDDDSD